MFDRVRTVVHGLIKTDSPELILSGILFNGFMEPLGVLIDADGPGAPLDADERDRIETRLRDAFRRPLQVFVWNSPRES